ncbi:MAG: hypothetical protein ACK4F9_02095 [Brevinematia bacterium]
MKKLTITGVVLTIYLLILSCVGLVSNKITVQITKGAGNNYYEIEVYSNSALSIDNTNTFVFSFQDSKNTILEVNTGRLESGFSSWTSYKEYARGVYIVVVKIDGNEDNRITPSQGDIYSYKYVVVNEDNQASVSFSSTDNWYGL